MSGQISPTALARMSAKELASSEVAHAREEIRQHAVKMVSLTHSRSWSSCAQSYTANTQRISLTSCILLLSLCCCVFV